jgi:SAM-dependent methyltransferase
VAERDYTGDYLKARTNVGEDYERALIRSPFDVFMTRQETDILSAVLAKLFPAGVPRALDFACGTGRVTQILEKHAGQTWGVDITPSQLEVARKKCPRTQFVLSDGSKALTSIPAVNVITAFRFFGNANEALRDAAMHSIAGQLLPGGIFILNNHRNRWSGTNIIRRMTGQRGDGDLSYWHLNRLLQRHGFFVSSVHPIGVWLIRARWRDPAVLNSGNAATLERLLRRRVLAPIAPDYVVVARRG